MSILEYTQRPWTPLQPGKVRPSDAETRDRIAREQGLRTDDEVWVNDEYQCYVTYLSPEGKAGVCQLSIKRNDGAPVQDWRDKQAIKNEVLGAERECIELYPAESRLVDTANQAFMFSMPVGQTIDIGFKERMVYTDAERRASLREIGGNDEKGSQRNWRPGISTGPDYRRIT